MTKLPTVRNLQARLAKIEALPAADLARLRKAVDAASSQFCTLMIDAGRGMWRPTETRAAAKAGDPMAIGYVEIMDAHLVLCSEENQRRRYHGTLRPWRKVAA